jgi:hypothetical protein
VVSTNIPGGANGVGTAQNVLTPFSNLINGLNDPLGQIPDLEAGAGIGLGFLASVADRLAQPSDPPRTRVRSSHGALLQAVMGKRQAFVGAVFDLQFSESAVLEDVFEVNPQSRGLPVDIVVQNVQQRNIATGMFELNAQLFEDFFGTNADASLLGDQRVQLRLREVALGPSKRLVYSRQYEGVRIENVTKSLSANDDRTVRIRATFRWQRSRRIA